MGRWTQYDEDDYRLPEGMKRVGYDSDTGRYYFRDRDGSLWQGPEGAEFGEMIQVKDVAIDISEDEDLESAPTRGDGYQSLATESGAPPPYRPSPYRTLFPFFLMICVFLLLVWRLVVFPASSAPGSAISCPEHTMPYWVQSGDSCWEIARTHGCSLDKLKAENPTVECEKLMPGRKLCVPDSASAGARRRARAY